jgi:sugar/nucleoside kinase (ribokinase family)
MTYDIFAVGHALVDERYELTTEQFSDLAQTFQIKKGEQTLIDEHELLRLRQQFQQWSLSAQLTAGGSAANSVCAAAKHDVSVFFQATLGDDQNGLAFEQQNQHANITNQFKCIAQKSTGTCLVLVDEQGERTLLTCPSVCIDIQASDINWTALKNSQYLFVEGYLLIQPTNFELIKQLIQFAKSHHVNIAFTLSDPAMARYFNQQALDIIKLQPNLLFANEEEFELISNTQFTPDNAQQWQVQQLPNSLLVVTQGSHGAGAFSAATQYHQGIKSTIKVADSNGAGDAFAGVFLATYLNTQSCEHSLQAAQDYAGKIVAQVNARL